MSWKNAYNEWLESAVIDLDLAQELQHLSEDELEDRFYKHLEFGTGGLRGIIGAGTNRINRFTVRRATQGLSDFLKSHGDQVCEQGVTIAFDSRILSTEFAEDAALTLCANGFKVYLFEGLRTTPELSFAVRELGCCAGIVITASHNPSQYNGYKVYGPDGCQITSAYAIGITNKINEISGWHQALTMNRADALESGRLQLVGECIDLAYITQVKSIAKGLGVSEICVVYTPLHGTGLMPVTRCLRELGYNDLHVVEAQAFPDGLFPTVKSPNPEEPEALNMAIELAGELNADIVLGTDPDCDRVGVAVRGQEGDYALLNGNQIGALLVHYLLNSGRTIPHNAAIIKTIVTSDLGALIAQKQGIRTYETLTGFKYIGEKIGEFEKTGQASFLFGYEESYGYLAGTFVRDKDAVIASVLIVEMCAYHKAQGKTLTNVMDDIYRECGYFIEELVTVTLTGIQGSEEIKRRMTLFKDEGRVHDLLPTIQVIEDYSKGVRQVIKSAENQKIELPASDVLKFVVEGGSWFAVRPSGTEPKIKFYYSARGITQESALDTLNMLKNASRRFE